MVTMAAWTILVQAFFRQATFLRLPLCPVGHLPRKGGDWMSRKLSPISYFATAARRRTAPCPPLLPPASCGWCRRCRR
ncbi:MAG: hypothetical protein EOQ55_06730 [Mesorhizobium sp.]|nr:hypothetical protein EOD29_11570 [Mesorhizobium sp. M1A.T.Ca.IN.004.03.1.1]RWG21596.1 MAG: hypothetical protein EOQ55_06730 [Mesorhizobium sp.]RWI88699.1 MAG: hypothetical protein EOR21_26650 [Mesorhizobium sp.]RWK32803.1 MAG: hypothetical protein EOR40_21255 [Mesorhizobium sp.]RWK88170.1 MAG: hypothetical protein EOR52_14420 [Mesorhizobium sp.]